jgi:NIPSNAP
MIYELRTYTFHPGKIPAWLELVPRILSLRADADKCRGYWTAEFGQLNQGWHLWGYDSLDQRAQLRAEMPKNERLAKELLPAVRSLLQRQDTRFLNPVIDLKPPASGGIYEIRIYRAQPGMAGAWTQLIKSYLPVREKYSPIVGLWTGEAPQPNEVVHMWVYPDLNARMKSRAAASADPEWQEFLGKGGAMLAEMQSTILLPASFSPMK